MSVSAGQLWSGGQCQCEQVKRLWSVLACQQLSLGQRGCKVSLCQGGRFTVFICDLF